MKSDTPPKPLLYEDDWTLPPPATTVTLSQARLLALLGGLCIGLPVFMVSTSLFMTVCGMSSLSHYYYVPIIGNLLLAWLMAIAALLVLLEPGDLPRRLAYRAAALMVGIMAVFPISGDGCARSDYTGLAFYHYDYAHPEIIGVLHHLRFSLFGMHLTNQEMHIGAGLALACLMIALSFDWQPVQVRRVAKRYGYAGAVPGFWSLRNLCCLGVLLCLAGATVVYRMDDGWIDGYKGLVPPELAFQSSILIFFGTAMLAEARALAGQGEA